MDLRRILFAGLAGLLLLALPAAPARAAAFIQPGARMIAPAGCTMNFVFRDTAHTYIGTAGHCTDTVGQSVKTPDGEIGKVAFRVLEGADDFALIRLDAGVLGRVRPDVLGFGGPTGSTSFDETRSGDLVRLFGHGMVLGGNDATRPRSGVLTSDDADEWRAVLPAIFGDSGGPVLHAPTGKALGVISGIQFIQTQPHTVLGTTVERILEILAEAGLRVRIVTAP
jgi:hypothetical protein